MSILIQERYNERLLFFAENEKYRLGILYDPCPEDPRNFDHLGKMVCFHKRYKLGDKDHDYHSEDYASWSELEADIIKREKPAVIYPLYLFDHSGITIKIGAFSGPDAYWDSGQVGFIYATKEDIRKWFNVQRITKKIQERVEQVLQEEVKLYDMYLRGQIFEVIVEDKQGNVIESCGGFYGGNIETNGICDHFSEYQNLLDNLKEINGGEIVETENH